MKWNRIGCKLRVGKIAFYGQRWFSAGTIALLIAVGASGANAQTPAAAPASAPNGAPPASPAQASTPTPSTQATAPASSQDIVGIWQGTLHIAQANRDLRTEIKIAKNTDGSYKLTFYSIDQGGQPFVAGKTTFEGGTLTFSMDAIGGKYEGKMSADGKTIDGTFTQGPNALGAEPGAHHGRCGVADSGADQTDGAGCSSEIRRGNDQTERAEPRRERDSDSTARTRERSTPT